MWKTKKGLIIILLTVIAILYGLRCVDEYKHKKLRERFNSK